MNNVRLYSNGTAVINREYAFTGSEPLRISIPVRKSDLDDVISSIAVFGDVTIVEPPTYTPTNADEPELSLSPNGVLRDLATKLAGTTVELDAGVTYKGKLLGLQPFRREFERTFIEQYRLIILTEKGVQQIEESSVTAMRFTDPVVLAEVEKSLRHMVGEIKADSSKVELTVRPNVETATATITYATPVAAWKIRYQLRTSSEGTELEGQAVVDNDTDDDWNDTLITVITGEPITFSTDLAEIRRPERGRVNVVSDRVAGAVSAEPAFPVAAGPALAAAEVTWGGGGEDFRVSGRKARRSRDSSAGSYGSVDSFLLSKADQSEAEVRESGDFAIFTSPDPLNLSAGRSAIVPLFQTAIGEAQTILLYREKDDAQRPYRAVRFQNSAEFSLGRGVCEIFVEGDFRGKCVLEPTKPGQELFLVHAKETGVRVDKKSSRRESRRMAIKISEGTVYGEILHKQRTSYRIQNNHREPFTLEIEHPRTFADARFAVSVSSGSHEEVEIPSGRRIRVTLPAASGLEVKVAEEQVEESQVVLSVAWLIGNVVGLKSPASEAEGIQECINLQKKVEGIEAEIREKLEASVTIAEEQERLMKLIPNGHAEQANSWRTDLSTAEKELREVKRTLLPSLRARLKEAQAELQKSLERLRYNWAESSDE